MRAMTDIVIAIFWFLIILLLHSYFGYFIIIYLLSRMRRDTKDVALDFKPLRVALVIAAYNEEDVIKEKIENCLALAYPREALSIWVASDGSADKTNQIVKEFSAKSDQVRLVALPRKGKANALNAVFKHVSSDIVVFSDANSDFSPEAVKEMVKHFADSKIGCVCGRLVYKNPSGVISGKGESFYWRYETQLKILESRLGYVAGANGSIYAIRRELFESLPARTINDDFLISMRIVQKGFKCIYEQNAVAFEHVSPTMEGEFLRHVRDGAGHYMVVGHLAGLLNPFLGIKAFIFWSHRILRWMAPFILILLLLINISLVSINFYRHILFLQILFYALAVGGLLSVKQKKIPFVIYAPFYFCNLNLALLIGFLKVILGKQKVMWDRTERL